MAVMARESWTDERLDDLKADMNRRFDAVDRRFDAVNADIRELRGEMKEMQRTMTHGFMVTSGIMVTGFGAVLSLVAF